MVKMCGNVAHVSRESLRSLMAAQDTLLFQKKRKAWRFYGGERPKSTKTDATFILERNLTCVFLFAASSHVMNELLETERAYVEELLCVLEVGTAIPSESPPSFMVFLFLFFTNVLCQTTGLRSRDGQPRHGPSHPQHPPQQKGHPVWQHV